MRKVLLLLCLTSALSSCHHKESKINESPTTPVERHSSNKVSPQNDFKRPVYNKEVTHIPDDVVLEDSSITIRGLVSAAVGSNMATYAVTSNDNATSDNYSASNSSASGYKANFASMASVPAPAPVNLVSRPGESKIPSQIIKNATIDFTVSSADSSHIRIQQMIAEYNAYLNLDKRLQSPEAIVQKLQIRVSPENFDKLIDAIMKESIYTETKDISADDVTAQFVDMEARLKSKHDVEKRYTDLLNRAQKVNDILVIESNRRQIQEEIESMEGNLRLMRDQVAYSTIYLTITQKIKVAPTAPEPEKPEMTFMEQVRAALSAGWTGIRVMAVFLLTIWPLLLIAAVAIIGVKVQSRRKGSAKGEETSVAEENDKEQSQDE